MLEIKGTDIRLTRGDTAYIEVPVFETDGVTPYYVTPNDVVTLQVRENAVTGSGYEPTLVMQGDISISDGVPLWTISAEASTIPAKQYFWDVQIVLQSGDVNTYNRGTLSIDGEITL